MTRMLQSYVQDAWWSPAEDVAGVEVLDASTGEPVARVSSEGLDLGAALDHARTVGQKSLGELTFHQRAVLLKQLALVLTERKQELYELSYKTGATKIDSWVDIDGGIGVLFTYSGKGRRELPNAKVQLDGPLEAPRELRVRLALRAAVGRAHDPLPDAGRSTAPNPETVSARRTAPRITGTGPMPDAPSPRANSSTTAPVDHDGSTPSRVRIRLVSRQRPHMR